MIPKNTIDIILEKYWDGESTLEEEVTLKKYFSSTEIHPEHQQFAPLFTYFERKQDIHIPEKETKVVKLNSRKWISVAAVFAFITASLFIFNRYQDSNKLNQGFAQAEIGEVNDPEEAKRITEEALMMLSKKLNHSQNIVLENMAYVNKANIFIQ